LFEIQSSKSGFAPEIQANSDFGNEFKQKNIPKQQFAQKNYFLGHNSCGAGGYITVRSENCSSRSGE
jgi:hypothetical protein